MGRTITIGSGPLLKKALKMRSGFWRPGASCHLGSPFACVRRFSGWVGHRPCILQWSQSVVLGISRGWWAASGGRIGSPYELKTSESTSSTAPAPALHCGIARPTANTVRYGRSGRQAYQSPSTRRLPLPVTSQRSEEKSEKRTSTDRENRVTSSSPNCGPCLSVRAGAIA